MNKFIKYIQKLISSIFTSENSTIQTNSSIGGGGIKNPQPPKNGDDD